MLNSQLFHQSHFLSHMELCVNYKNYFFGLFVYLRVQRLPLVCRPMMARQYICTQISMKSMCQSIFRFKQHRTLFKKLIQILSMKFHYNPHSVSWCGTCRETNRRTDMMYLTVAFYSCYATTPRKSCNFKRGFHNLSVRITWSEFTSHKECSCITLHGIINIIVLQIFVYTQLNLGIRPYYNCFIFCHVSGFHILCRNVYYCLKIE